ncbi:MAG TPA: RNA polymerase sigma factor SigJ, partial [Planctomycetaceae bacterium]|nr:RNA polymerase sigma factor SigJ [Planctomycetaceae bacterium]
DREAVREPEAFLRRVVTRLCLDHLKSARHRREAYVGPWLPEPLVEADEPGLDDVTLPLLLALERLSPLERAAFLLHDVFGIGFDEIAETVERTPEACRQLASRARVQVRAERPRFPVAKERGLQIAEAFVAASRRGDMDDLRALLAEDITVYTDGGGKATAFLEPVAGLENEMPLWEKLARVFAKKGSQLIRYGYINGLPGFVTIEFGDILQTTALELAEGRILAVYITRNPDKLQHVAGETN